MQWQLDAQLQVAFDKTSQSFAHVRHMDGTEADVQRFEVTAYSCLTADTETCLVSRAI